MAVAARLSMIGESGYGEPEKDANSVLMDLDKGFDYIHMPTHDAIVSNVMYSCYWAII